MQPLSVGDWPSAQIFDVACARNRLTLKDEAVLPLFVTVHVTSVSAVLLMSGFEMSGLLMSGLLMSGFEISGLNTSALEMSGLLISGLEMSGLLMSGFEMSGLSRIA